MQYRPFGKLNFGVSALGFGAMRLPVLGNQADIDEPAAVGMIRHAIDHGVNYVDTAFLYHGGNGEVVVGKALRDGYRQRAKVATKLWVPAVAGYGDFDHQLNEQLRRLQTDHVDFYLLHGLRKARWEAARDLGFIRWAEGAVRDGRIGHLGFSFHSSLDDFKLIVDAYDGWALCQVQFNYVDEHYQAGIEGVRYAAAKGLAVVVMEPLLGGRLANPPERVRVIWERAPRRRTPVEWAFRWLWRQPEIAVVLSGMSTMQQVQDNLEIASRAGTDPLSVEELPLYNAARDAYAATFPIPCTECRYCMPCPNGVDIPLNFQLLNRAVGIPDFAGSRYHYKNEDKGRLAGACIECGTCEEQCPQSIPISDWMQQIVAVMERGEKYVPERTSAGGASNKPTT